MKNRAPKLPFFAEIHYDVGTDASSADGATAAVAELQGGGGGGIALTQPRSLLHMLRAPTLGGGQPPPGLAPKLSGLSVLDFMTTCCRSGTPNFGSSDASRAKLCSTAIKAVAFKEERAVIEYNSAATDVVLHDTLHTLMDRFIGRLLFEWRQVCVCVCVICLRV